MPERIPGKTLIDSRIRVQPEYLRERGILPAKSPTLLNNLLGYNPSRTWFYFRDLPEVWEALGVTA